ncbi:MAG TPA: prolyl oligopeptidase family serine peptidase [Vicinamibacteria bacterium]
MVRPLALLPVLLLGGQAVVPPVAAKRAVTDDYHGTAVVDNYRWLEDGADPEVQRWSDAQNAYARAVLDGLPHRKAIEKRVAALISWESPGYFAIEQQGGVFFALKSQPPKEQPFLVTVGSPGEGTPQRVVLDPVVLDPSGGTSIDFYVPSRDARLVAVSLSKGGSENGDVHVYEVASGKERTGDLVPGVNGGTAGGSVAWNADGSGFFYTRYPRGAERPPEDRPFFQQVWFHKLGTSTEADAYAIGREFPRIAEVQLETSADGAFTLATVALGDGGQFMHWLHGPSGTWTQITRYEDDVTAARFGLDGALYLLSKKGAPKGKLVRLPVGQTGLAGATVVLPEGDAVLGEFLPAKSRLYVVEQAGGPTRLRALALNGAPIGPVATLPISTVAGLVRLGDGDDILFANTSFVEPLAWYRLTAADGAVKKTALAQTSPWDFSGVEVVREQAISADGTRVPLTVLRPNGIALDGSNPTLLTGYGGFGLAITPGFSRVSAAWLEQGGVKAIANLRGGSEFGEDWHKAGALTHKQNVFDDFYACARLLIEKGYTRPEKLAIQGGSNGGLLVGAALTQHPEAYKAVVAQVGYYDSLRVEAAPNGVFNTTEYGSVKDPEQFKALYAYSPYHHVKDGTQYPAILFMTGANDPRVDPFHSRKMVARLQASGTRQPVLLRTTSKAGHGFGTALGEAIAQSVDYHAFLFDQLGVAYREVK